MTSALYEVVTLSMISPLTDLVGQTTIETKTADQYTKWQELVSLL